MRNIIRIAIRVFLVFTIFNFLNVFILSINNILYINNIDGITSSALFGADKIELLKLFIPSIISWCIYFYVVVMIWIKSDNISKVIIGNGNCENISLTLSSDNILLIGINILCIYFILDSLPSIFYYVSEYLVSKTRFVDRTFLEEYTTRQILQIIGIFVKIISAILLIKYKEKIVKLIRIKD